MPGTNAGTGQPINFRCAGCRRRDTSRAALWAWPKGSVQHVKLTGKRRRAYGRRGLRNGAFEIEYACMSCGHRGWSRHADINRRYEREFTAASDADDSSLRHRESRR